MRHIIGDPTWAAVAHAAQAFSGTTPENTSTIPVPER